MSEFIPTVETEPIPEMAEPISERIANAWIPNWYLAQCYRITLNDAAGTSSLRAHFGFALYGYPAEEQFQLAQRTLESIFGDALTEFRIIKDTEERFVHGTEIGRGFLAFIREPSHKDSWSRIK